MQIPEALTAVLDGELILRVLRAGAIAIGGLLATRGLADMVLRFGRRSSTEHVATLARRGTLYGGVLLTAAWTLSELGFDLSVVMGVAGVATVAIGFASQTSMSNLISGLFLVLERPFSVGDIIQLGPTSGVVLSIDALSVKLRTFDNLYVRIPNETLIKSELTNLTRFQIRRFDLKLTVAHDVDLDALRPRLIAAATEAPIVLREPPPVCMITGIGDAGVGLQISVWGPTPDHVALRDQTILRVRKALAAHGGGVWPSQRRVLVDAAKDAPAG
jgi:small-conductance mechanosensitive channel